MPTAATKQLLTVAKKARIWKRRKQGTTIPQPTVIFVPANADRSTLPAAGPGVILIPEVLKTVWGALSGTGEYMDLRDCVRLLDIHGGRGGCKSYTLLLMVAALALWKWGNSGVRSALILRAIQASIAESSHAQLVAIIDAQGWREQFHITENRITSHAGARVLFRGLSADSTGRGAARLKSIADTISLCVIEEAAEVTSVEDLDVLLPSLRGDRAQLVALYNPKTRLTPITQWLGADGDKPNFPLCDPALGAENAPGCLLRVITGYRDNPFLPLALLLDAQNCQATRPEEYAHIWEGGYQLVSGGILERRHLLACFDLAQLFEPDGNVWMPDPDKFGAGFDPADSGTRDAHALAVGCGDTLMGLMQLNQPSVTEAAKFVYKTADEGNYGYIAYDAGGVGAGVRGQFLSIHNMIEREEGSTLRGVPTFACHFGGGVPNPDARYDDKLKRREKFANWKAYQFYMLAVRSRNSYDLRRYYENALATGQTTKQARQTAIKAMGPERLRLILNIHTASMDPVLLETFLAQAVEPTWLDTERLLTVESKKQLKARGVKSHDLLDAVALYFSRQNARHYNEEEAA